MNLLNRKLLNIFKNFIPNKIVTVDDSNPPWVNEQIKSLIRMKNQMFRLYVQNGKKQNDYILLQNANHQLSDLLNLSKKKYFERLTLKLSSPNTSAKAYWAILKSFVNGKKIPSIPPLFANGQIVTDFLSKADIFNTFFSQQCTDIVITSMHCSN